LTFSTVNFGRDALSVVDECPEEARDVKMSVYSRDKGWLHTVTD
jgi:hypothetical protein